MSGAKEGRILFVDDDQIDQESFERFAKGEDFPFQYVIAGSLKEATVILESERFDAVLIDHNLGDGTAFDLFDKTKSTPIIIITSSGDVEIAVRALKMGACDYLIKDPGDNYLKTLVVTIEKAIKRKEMEERLVHSFEKLQRVLGETVHALASALEKRDSYTAGHQQRVSRLARAIGQEMRLPLEQVEGIRIAGSLHDIGKVYVPAEILAKPSRLTELEFGFMKTHPQVGYEIIKGIEFDWPIAQAVIQHHERLNGTGYPEGLSGDETILEAKILAVADVVEAMSSHRPYRPALGIDKALEEVIQNRGILYEADVADSVVRLFSPDYS